MAGKWKVICLHFLLQVVVEVKVTPASTAEDVEAALLTHLTQTSHDTMTPTSPTIFCFDDVGSLGVRKRNFESCIEFSWSKIQC